MSWLLLLAKMDKVTKDGVEGDRVKGNRWRGKEDGTWNGIGM